MAQLPVDCVIPITREGMARDEDLAFWWQYPKTRGNPWVRDIDGCQATLGWYKDGERVRLMDVKSCDPDLVPVVIHVTQQGVRVRRKTKAHQMFMERIRTDYIAWALLR